MLDSRERHAYDRLGDLFDKVRVKRAGPLMHLKAYVIDGAVLGTRSANFGASAELKQTTISL